MAVSTPESEPESAQHEPVPSLAAAPGRHQEFAIEPTRQLGLPDHARPSSTRC